MAINLQAIQEDKRQRELAAMTPEPEEKGLLDSLYDSIVRASDYVDGPELKEEGYSEIVEPATSLYLKTIDNEIKAANNYQQAVDNWESNDAVDYARGNLMASPFKEAGREFINAYADDTQNSPFFSAGANDLMQSNIGYNYIMNDEDKLSRARKIEQEIGIPSGTVLYDKEAWANANKLYENIQKQKDFFSENGKEMSLEDVQKLNPILTRISTSDPAAGALIMADMGNIKKQMDIFDTFDEYLEVGKLKLELDNLGEKYRKNEQTFDDMYRMQELQDKINRFYDKHDNNFFDSPLNFAVAGLASSWPEMQGSIEEGLKEQAFWTMAGIQAGGIVGTGFGGVGVAPGAAIGGLGGFGMGVLRNFPRLAKVGGIILKNMTPGKYTGFKLGSFGGMAAPETGSRYLEYRDMKDKDGKPVMTRDEASDRAVIGGTVNAFLETFPTFEAMGRMAKGNKAGKEVVDLIFRGAEKKYTEPIAKTAAAEFALNTLKGAAVESGEESLQTAADDLMLNDIEKTHPGTIEGGIKSYKDIATDALGAFVMSYPTSLLFGAAEGLGAGAFSTSRYAAQHKQIRAQEQIFGEQVQNTAIGNALVSELQDAVQNSKLKDTAPDVQQQIIKEKAAGTGYEIVYIDTEMAMEKESGRKDLEAVAKAANISSEELETAIEEKGTLAVPLECFAQADSSPELLESASYKTEAQSIARMKKEAIETIQRLKEADQKHLGQLKNMVDVVAEEYFPADENDKQGKARQDMCKAIIMTFAENPAMGWNEMMKMVQSERMELLQPALDFINETSGKGTVVIPTEDGKGFRATNNFQWYSEWSKNHNYRAMTKADKEEMAEEMIRGNVNVGIYRNIPPEALAADIERLDEINGKIKALEEIKDKMKELNGVEMKLTEGLTKEGFSVYRAVYDQLKEAKGYASRSARAGAIIYARRADLYAKIMREKGQTNYTAKDFMERNIIQFGGQTVGEFNQISSDMNLYNLLPIERKKEVQQEGKKLAAKLDELRKLENNKKFNPEEICVICKAPDIFKEFNFNSKNIVIKAKELLGVSKSKKNNWHTEHSIFKNILRQIPKAMQDPLCIMDSIKHPGRIVVILDIDVKNENDVASKIFIPVEIDKPTGIRKSPGEKVIANIATSIYPRELSKISNDLQELITKKASGITNSKIYYLNGNKNKTELIRPTRVQYPIELIRNSLDLRKRLAKKYVNVNNNFPQNSDSNTQPVEKFYQSAWHGSPYDFDEFDLGAIGNGQGGAVHGWGLYFANKKQVSEKYRKSVIAYKNKETGEMLPTDITNAALEIEERYGHEKAIEVIQKGINNDPDATNISAKQQMLEFLANKDIYERTKGRLYKVDIPNNKDLIQEENNYLNQTKAIRQKMAEAVNGLNDTQKASFVEKLQHYFMKDVEPSADAEVVISQAVALEKGLKAIQKYHSSKMQKVQERAMERGLISKSAIERVKKSPEEAAKVAKEYEAILKETQKLAEAAQKTEGVKQAKFKQTQQDKLESYKKEPSKLLEAENVISGKEFYKGITAAFGNDKQASLYLNEHGIKGITWNDEGGQFVIFDDKAISIIEKFNQGIKGSITPMSNGQRIINIFESADESTFLHEMGHLFLLDLEELAQIDERSSKELATVTEWAAYKKEDVKGYKGTPFEGEFLKLAADIEAAEKNGDIATAEQLKRKWMHERFARAFEMYLEFGQAPSTGLKSVFRKFKQFLIHIYIGFTGEGVRATPEVERIMARMIASDSEIEAAALSDRYKDITKAGGEKLLTETESETMARWHEEAKAEAKEKLLAIIMKDLKEEKAREYQAKLDKEREEVTRFIESQPVFIAQKVLSENGGSKEDVVAMGIYGSIEQLEADLDKVKDILPDRAIEDRMADYAKELDQQMIDEQITEEKISEIMNRTYYHNKLLALETAALEDRTRSLQRISSKTKNAIDEANIALDGIEDNTNIKKAKYSDGVKKLLKALSKLRVSKQWNGEELQAIDKIINSTTKEEASDALKEFVNRQGEWKRNLKNVQEAFDGRMKLMDKMAREELAKKSLADACNYGKYVRMEKQASQMMNKFIRLGKWEAALRQQEIRLQAAAMAKYAKKNQEQLKKLTDRVKKQLTAKTVKLPKDERYWHRRMAYLLNLAKENPAEPVDGVIPLREIFKGLNDSLDIQEMDFTDIYKTITRDGFGGYMTLTMAELEDAVNMLTVLYTTGRDKFRVKSFDGMNLSDVVDEICEDETGIGIMTQNRFINPDQGGVGYNDLLANIPHIGEVLSRAGQKYITSMVKPELLLKLIGNKAYKYIYGLYERAANQEGKMSAESIRKLQEILSVYSHDEKRDWKTKKYTFETGAGVEKLSKENIICMALNRGNETNWNRLAKGMRVQFEDLAKFIDEHMTAKDWQTVQAIWDYLDSYWEDTTRVEEKLNGITMKKVQRRPFWVKPKGNDKYIKLEGGYYPIAYNPEKSAKAEAQSVDAAAQRTMSGAQVLGTGRGFTKARNESMNISRPLKLSFDVITEHTSNVIHNITWRLACRDVYRLTHSTKFEELIRNTLGAEALRSINEWVVDCWKTMPGATDQATETINKLFGWLRRNAGFNIMGYRMWPAVENVTNIFPMMDQLGAADTMAAIGDYYAHKTENDRLILRSSFMTNRINNMDRDIKNIPGLFDESMRGLGWMKQHAYSMLAYTDLMLSAPLWCRAYKNSIAKHYMEVEKENKEQVAAFKSAQDRVHELNTAMYDLKREKEKILLKLHPEYEEEYTPMRAKEIGYLNSELNRINKELAPMEKARWQAELELDKLANVDLMLPDDILKEAEERAVHSADAAVRNVFGSGHIKDLAPIQKGGEIAKMLTCFYSFFNTQANAILAAYYQGKFAKADISGLQNLSVWMPMAKSILFRIFLTSALTTVLKMALLGDGSDDKDKYRKIKLEDGTEVKEEIPQLERFLTEYAKNTISTASGTLWGIRDIAGAITNYIFEGNDFGGARFASVPSIAIEKSIKTFEMAMQKGERDARIEADEERRKARYDKMTPKQKKKFDEELQYRHPPKRITWADKWKMGVGAITSATAAETGITDTVANTVMTTLQYMADGDGRYDPSIENIFWSAFWNKKPVERAIPEKPVQPKNNKKKKGA